LKASREHVLTVFGQYVLSPKIFGYLEENIKRNIRERASSNSPRASIVSAKKTAYSATL